MFANAKMMRQLEKEDMRNSALRIIGGSAISDDSKYPWMAMSAGSLPRCGLAVISKRWLLTASHCVLNAAETGFVRPSHTQKIHYACAVQGSHSCKTTSVVQIEAHPCFDPCCDVHDIALIKVKDDMNVPFAPLNGVTDYIPNEMLMDGAITMMGWGSTCGSGRCVPVDLQTLAVDVVTMQTCRDKNPSRVGRNSGYCGRAGKCGSLFDDGDVFCAGGHKGYDSCNGDSGSPVVFSDPRSGKDIVVGIVILGSEVPLHNGACGAQGRVSVLTRLFPYAQYINSTMHGKNLDGCWGNPLPIPGTQPTQPAPGPSIPPQPVAPEPGQTEPEPEQPGAPNEPAGSTVAPDPDNSGDKAGSEGGRNDAESNDGQPSTTTPPPGSDIVSPSAGAKSAPAVVLCSVLALLSVVFGFGLQV